MRTVSPMLAWLLIVGLAGCSNRAEMRLAQEMRVFALDYHNKAAEGAPIVVDPKTGFVRVEPKEPIGPGGLDDLPAVDQRLPNLARKIRDGSFIVIWKGKIRPEAEENAAYYLGHEVGIEEKGGWLMRADGHVEKVTAEDFTKLKPLPTE